MAHHLALHGSQFHYSHDAVFLPAHAMFCILRDLPIQQRFWTVRGKSFPFHVAFYFLHRPAEMETASMYQFFMEAKFMSKSEAESRGDEYFAFYNKHPCLKDRVAVHRKQQCVPIFLWKWLGSTRNFSTSLMESVSMSDVGYNCKEEYALKFMILFLPFRTHDDLQLERSYQKRFQKAVTDEEFNCEMLQVAENIQNVHNSMQSSMPQNGVTAKTYSVSMEDDVENDDEDGDIADNSLRKNFSNLFTDETVGKQLEADSVTFNPKHCGKALRKQRGIAMDHFAPSCPMTSVVDITSEMVTEAKNDATFQDIGRFKTTTSELNSLAMRHIIVSTDCGDCEGNNIPTVHGNAKFAARPSQKEERNPIVDATGTWLSIVLWGVNAGFDEEQQTAFKILAATYVLTFYNEASNDTIDLDTFEEHKEKLETLARKDLCIKNGQTTCLRMFVTGPAGS